MPKSTKQKRKTTEAPDPRNAYQPYQPYRPTCAFERGALYDAIELHKEAMSVYREIHGPSELQCGGKDKSEGGKCDLFKCRCGGFHGTGTEENIVQLVHDMQRLQYDYCNNGDVYPYRQGRRPQDLHVEWITEDTKDERLSRITTFMDEHLFGDTGENDDYRCMFDYDHEIITDQKRCKRLVQSLQRLDFEWVDQDAITKQVQTLEALQRSNASHEEKAPEFKAALENFVSAVHVELFAAVSDAIVAQMPKVRKERRTRKKLKTLK